MIVHDDERNIVGGLTGKIYWNRLEVDILWLDESIRSQGFGARLLELAEQTAITKGCNMIKLDTVSFQAPDFYLKNGYQVYGKLEDDPEQQGLSSNVFAFVSEDTSGITVVFCLMQNRLAIINASILLSLIYLIRSIKINTIFNQRCLLIDGGIVDT